MHLKLVLSGFHMRWYEYVLSLFCLLGLLQGFIRFSAEFCHALSLFSLSALLPSLTQVCHKLALFVKVIAEFNIRCYWCILSLFSLSALLPSLT